VLTSSVPLLVLAATLVVVVKKYKNEKLKIK